MPRRRHRRPHSLDIRPTEAAQGQLHSHAQLRHIASPPPRAMTQYVSVASEYGDASEITSNASSIYLPSTMGLRAGPQVQCFGSPPSTASTSSIMPTFPSNTPSLRRANSSPASTRYPYVSTPLFLCDFYAILIHFTGQAQFTVAHSAIPRVAESITIFQ